MRAALLSRKVKRPTRELYKKIEVTTEVTSSRTVQHRRSAVQTEFIAPILIWIA